MKMIGKKLVFVSFILLGLISYAFAGGSGKEKAALSAAEKWLDLVDKERYGESWMQSAEYFKNSIDRGEWEKSMQAFRKPLGDIVLRQIKSASYHTSLPGAPDGEYVVIQFESSFENKKSAIETVTPMLGKDNVWRISGYYIR